MTALQKIDHNKHLAGPATWDHVKYWADTAAKLSHASIAAQVMAGFALLELHKKHNVKAGQPKKELPNHSEILSDASDQPDTSDKKWPDLVKDNAGVSEDTARNWMKMADGIKAKWKKLAPQEKLRELMSVPVGEWNDKQVAAVQTAVQKATDGMTQTEFLRELGIAKKAPGNPNAKGGEKKKLTMSEEAELRKRQATEDWAAIYRMASVYRDKFVLLPDADVEAQIATLEEALNARKAWLKNPVGKRDPKAIADMLKTK